MRLYPSVTIRTNSAILPGLSVWLLLFACAVCQPATADTLEVRKHAQRYMVSFYNIFLKALPEYGYYLTGPGMLADEASNLVSFEVKGW